MGSEREVKGADDVIVARATPEEPTVECIHALAEDGLAKVGHHGPMASMGVPRSELPHWDDIQLLVAQFASKPDRRPHPQAGSILMILRDKRPFPTQTIHA